MVVDVVEDVVEELVEVELVVTVVVVVVVVVSCGPLPVAAPRAILKSPLLVLSAVQAPCKKKMTPWSC